MAQATTDNFPNVAAAFRLLITQSFEISSHCGGKQKCMTQSRNLTFLVSFLPDINSFVLQALTLCVLSSKFD